MSKDQLSALLLRVKEDKEFAEKLKNAGDLDAAQVIAQEAGFDVTKEDWLSYKEEMELSDEDLEGIAGGSGGSCGFDSCKGNK